MVMTMGVVAVLVVPTIQEGGGKEDEECWFGGGDVMADVALWVLVEWKESCLLISKLLLFRMNRPRNI